MSDHDTNEEPERFYAIRRADREMFDEEHAWFLAADENDWAWAAEADNWEPVEYEIVEMTVRPIARRTFGYAFDDDEAAVTGEQA